MITECISNEPTSEVENASSPVEMLKIFFDVKSNTWEKQKKALQNNNKLAYGRYPNKSIGTGTIRENRLGKCVLCRLFLVLKEMMS